MTYDKTEMNAFVQNLYDQKMQEGKHGHYETMFHVVHAAIAAYTNKLRQGVELPEPDTEEPASNYFGKPCYYTEETLLQYGDARDQAGYLRGLEDAKRVCLNWSERHAIHDGCTYEDCDFVAAAVDCAAAIEKLKGGE